MEIRRILSQMIERKTRLVPEDLGKSILARYGIKAPPGRSVMTVDEALRLGSELGYPLVVKALVPELIHKSDRGAVRVGVTTDAALHQAALELHGLFPDAPLLVEKMVLSGAELIAGLFVDGLFGPCLMVGTGGIFTELFQDVDFLMLPVTRADVLAALRRLKGYGLLTGFRGAPPYPVEPIVDAIMGLARFAEEAEGYYESVDINPLVAGSDGVVALDATILVKAEPPAPQTPDVPKRGIAGFFSPRSVAIIGASFTPGKSGHEVIKNILDNGYEGELHLVNPKGGELLGLPVTPSIGELPAGVDLAVIILPAKDTPGAVRQAAEKGIRQMVLSAGGFAEVDDYGAHIQQELSDIIREKGVRVIGPNTSGHTSTPHHFTSTFFPLGKIRRGTVSYIAQTGNFATHTMKYILTGEYFGVSRVIGLGNKIDMEESEALQFLGDDPETSAIVMYLESIKYPQRFLAVAREVTRRKPVIMLKGGATEAGRHAAVAHTAAMAAEDRLVDGMLRQAGIVRIYEYTHLILTAKVLSMMPLAKGNRISFLAPSGAMLVALSDLCTRLGLEIPDLEPTTVARLQEVSPPFIRMRNPVDIWAAASVKGVGYGYAEGMEAVLKDPNIDAVVPIILLTRETGIPDYGFITELAKKYPEKPILVGFSGDKQCIEECRAEIEPQGIPTFYEIEQPFEVLSILARCREVLDRASRDGS